MRHSQGPDWQSPRHHHGDRPPSFHHQGCRLDYCSAWRWLLKEVDASGLFVLPLVLPKFIVACQGELVEEGTHDQLLQIKDCVHKDASLGRPTEQLLLLGNLSAAADFDLVELKPFGIVLYEYCEYRNKNMTVLELFDGIPASWKYGVGATRAPEALAKLLQCLIALAQEGRYATLINRQLHGGSSTWRLVLWQGYFFVPTYTEHWTCQMSNWQIGDLTSCTVADFWIFLISQALCAIVFEAVTMQRGRMQRGRMVKQRRRRGLTDSSTAYHGDSRSCCKVPATLSWNHFDQLHCENWAPPLPTLLELITCILSSC